MRIFSVSFAPIVKNPQLTFDARDFPTESIRLPDYSRVLIGILKDGKMGAAVIGVGIFGEAHVRTLSSMPGVELAGVYDVDNQRVREIASRYQCPVFASDSEVFENKDVDFVSICTPEPNHLEPSVRAAQHNKHILLEKPIATNMEDANTIIRCAKSAGVKLMVGHIKRFGGRYLLAKEAIARGDIGEVVNVTARFIDPRREQVRRKGRVSINLIMGIHDLDLIRWYIGSEPRSVYSRSVRKVFKKAGLPVEDSVYSIYEFENGCLGALELGCLLPDNYPTDVDQTIDVIGSEGVISVDCNDRGIAVGTLSKIDRPDLEGSRSLPENPWSDLRIEIQHFIDCIKKDKEPRITTEDARIALQMALSAMESDRTNKIVPINVHS